MTYQRIVAYTLVDITSSGAVRLRDANTTEYHQQQNLNVLLQTIGLRTQPINYTVNCLGQQDLSKYEFDSSHTGDHFVWRLTFDIQHHSVWHDGNNELGLLELDANGVAITTDLNETAHFDVNVFNTQNYVNLYFKSE